MSRLKKTFRRVLIRLFALDYIVELWGKKIRWTRGANIIFPLFVLCGYLNLSDRIYPFPTIFAYGLLAIALFFGFVYFNFYPITKNDSPYLDDTQRWQLSYFDKTHTDLPKSYNSQWVFWVNPLVIVLFLIVYLLCN